MAYFADEHEVYEHIGGLLRELAGDEELASRAVEADTVLQYVLRDPESTITVRMQAGRPVEILTGDSGLDPEIVMVMDADTAHRFWLGRLNVTVALARAQIRARGPVAKVLRLVPLV